MQSIVGTQDGFRSGLKIGRKRVTNCAAMLVHDCSTWAQQSSKCGIFSGIAMCKQPSSGMHTVYRIGSFGQSECTTYCRSDIVRTNIAALLTVYLRSAFSEGFSNVLLQSPQLRR